MMVRAALAAVLATILLLPSSALAGGKASGRDRAGDVKAKGLTAKERRALDILSVTAGGDRSVGLLVTVKFRGNFERAIGRGHLRNGLAALVLRPRAKGKRPTGILTAGPGSVGTTRRRTASGDVGVVRDGRKLTFFVAGRALEGVKSMEVKAFAGRPSRARSSTTKLELAVRWLRITAGRAADAEKLAATDLKQASCEKLGDLQAIAKFQRALLETDEQALVRLRGDILESQRDIKDRDLLLKTANAIRELLGSEVTDTTVARDLAVALKLTDRALARNKEARDNLLRFEGKIDGLLSARCTQQVDTVVGPPVIKGP